MKLQIFKLLSTTAVVVLCAVAATAQSKFTISGQIKDKKNGEDIIGATIFIKELSIGATTNAYGFYSISVPPGTYTISVSYIGYVTQTKTISLTSNTSLNLEIEEEKIQLEEVVVNAEKPEDNYKSVEMSINKLDMKQISKVPALLGEVDVVRSIQLLPGVSTVGEGASGFNVRGGSIDQNLILLDEAPVYNSSHLFGFFSVFNPDAVRDVKLYKGGIPSLYGGRLSSILDVRLKEGNSKRFSGQGGVGIIFSRFTLEGPIKKDKASFIVALRRSYADILARPFLASNPDFRDLKLYFYDFTVKSNYAFSPKSKLYLSGYLGRDVFGIGAFGFNWGNSTFTTRWNYIISPKLFMNLTMFYSNYDYQLGAETNSGGDRFLWKSNIINYSGKADFTWYANSTNTITFGAQSILYNFKPGTFETRVSGIVTRNQLLDKYGVENAAYIGNEQTIVPRFTVSYGFRLSSFTYLKGVYQTYNFEKRINEPAPYISEDTATTFTNIKTYVNPEPRVSLKYELDDKSSIKSSYMRTAQYLQLISNTAASIPLDVWTSATNNIKPQQADQIAIGYFRNFGNNKDYEFSVESYYKWLYNQIDYIDGADLLLNPRLEGELLEGKGRAYGAEFYLRKATGAFTGWISYTLARTERLITGINNNQWYPTRFDRLHNVNITLNYQVRDRVLIFSDRWNFSINNTYQSGTPVNLPTNRFYFGPYLAPHNPDNPRNNIRIPDYWRIDVSATLKSKRGNKLSGMTDEDFKGVRGFFKRYDWDLTLGVYNVLGRRNPFAIYPRQQAEVSTNTELVRFSLFGFPIPALTYNFRF